MDPACWDGGAIGETPVSVEIKLVDGSSSRLPDTEENQKAFPQPKTQKPGLGFPLIRWVALISLATAAVEGFADGPYAGKATGETALFRQLLEELLGNCPPIQL